MLCKSRCLLCCTAVYVHVVLYWHCLRERESELCKSKLLDILCEPILLDRSHTVGRLSGVLCAAGGCAAATAHRAVAAATFSAAQKVCHGP